MNSQIQYFCQFTPVCVRVNICSFIFISCFQMDVSNVRSRRCELHYCSTRTCVTFRLSIDCVYVVKPKRLVPNSPRVATCGLTQTESTWLPVNARLLNGLFTKIKQMRNVFPEINTTSSSRKKEKCQDFKLTKV